jgi:TIR domain-containing protein
MAGEVLLQLEIDSHRECRVVTGLPTDERVRLTVTNVSPASSSTESAAKTLHDEIADALRRLGGRFASLTCQGRYNGTGRCHADTLPSAYRDHNVLVVVEDASRDIASSVPDAFRRFPSHDIVPVVERGARRTPSASIARHVMLSYDPGAIGALVPDILMSARVGTDAFRIFVSYRHDDCATAAAGIFHQLAEARFAVFLDRFCGEPGQDFVARITSELFDKSCLLVLETPDVEQSGWMKTEVATAWTHHLGLLAVDLPGSRGFFSIAPRLDCTSANGGAPLGHGGTLSRSHLDRIVEFVRANMADQGARRRRWQRQNLGQAVSASGITDRGETLLGRRLTGASSVDYHAILSARPPGASTFKRARQVAAPERAILFGPLSHQMAGDAELTAWLDDVSGVRAFDEGTMIPTLRAARLRPL